MKNTAFFLSLAFAAWLVVPQPAGAETFSCNGDPFYAKSGAGQTIMGSRLRNRPCMADSEVMTVIPGATKVTVLGEMDGWYKVKFGDKTGWVGSWLIKTSGLSAAKEIKEEVKAVKEEAKAAVKEIKTTVKAEAPAVLSSIIGVNEKNYGLLVKGDKALLKRLKGKIVLRVESRGELYTVNATGIKRLLVKTLEEIDDETLQPKTEAVKAVSEDAGKIVLSGKLQGNKLLMSWSATGSDFPLGFKVVKAEHANPVYPGDDYHYLSDSSVRSDAWGSLAAGKTYYFRVCRYLGGKCGVYSNALIVKIPAESTEVSNGAGTINLAVTTQEDKAKLAWTLNGFTSEMGFKIVVADHANPVYPGDDYHYLSDAGVRSDAWEGLESGKTYHFRVCQYLGGKCGIYSNDVTWVAP